MASDSFLLSKQASLRRLNSSLTLLHIVVRTGRRLAHLLMTSSHEGASRFLPMVLEDSSLMWACAVFKCQSSPRFPLKPQNGPSCNRKRIPTCVLSNSCLLVADIETTDRHKLKIRPDIKLTELTHWELMRYNTEGMENPQLSTTISSRRPSMAQKHDAERCGYLKGATQQTPDTGRT